MKNIQMFITKWKYEILIALLFLFFYTMLLPQIPIFDGDSFYYIAKARRMLSTGDLLNTTVLMAKPVLVLWVMALFYKLWNISLFSTYLWHTLFSAGTLVLVYVFVKEFAGIKVARLSTAILLTSLMFFYQSCSPMLDIPMVFFLVLAQYSLFKFIISGKNIYLYLTALSCGLNFLTKGLEGALLPPITFVLYLMVNRINPFKKYKNILGHGLLAILIFVLVVSIWIIPQVQVHGREFTGLLYRENIERFFHPIDETGGYRKVSSEVQRDPYLNILYLILAFLPWSPLIIPAILTIYKQQYFQLKPLLSFQLIWFYFLLLITSVSGHYKGPRYLLPLLPALAMITGVYLQNVSTYCKRTAYRSFYGVGIFFLLLALAVLGSRFEHGEEQYIPLVLPFLLGIAFTLLLAGYLWKKESFQKAIFILLIGSIVTYTLFLSESSYYVKRLLPEYTVAEYFQKNIPAQAEIAVWQIKVHSLDFYLKKELRYISEDKELANLNKTSFLVAEKKELEKLLKFKQKAKVVYQNKDWAVLDWR